MQKLRGRERPDFFRWNRVPFKSLLFNRLNAEKKVPALRRSPLPLAACDPLHEIGAGIFKFREEVFTKSSRPAILLSLGGVTIKTPGAAAQEKTPDFVG